MFKSSENLRMAAQMRALQRVAGPWREARTSWFDGTPDSIAARLAATERVLTFARQGYTTAHVALEREAAHARAELADAQHRLMTDFLDDGARAFKGSQRVAGEVSDFFDDGYRVVPDEEETNFHYDPDDYDDHIQIKGSQRVGGYHDVDPDKPWRNTMADEPYASLQETPDFADLPLDGHYPGRHRLHENDHGMWEDQLMEGGGPGFPQNGPGKHRASTADYPLGPGYDRPGFGLDDIAEYEDHLHEHGYHTEPEDLHGLEHKLHHTDFDDDDPARYSRRNR